MGSTKSERLTLVRVLLVDDDETSAARVRSVLDAVRAVLNIVLTHVPRLDLALEHEGREPQDVLLFSLKPMDGRGIDGLDQIRRVAPGLPVIVLGESGDNGLVQLALEKGAREFLCRDRLEPYALVTAVRHAAERRRVREAQRQRKDKAAQHQAVLLELAKSDNSNLEDSFRRIARTSSQILGIERVSVWLFNEDHSEIVCEALYRLSGDSYEKGLTLKARDYPRYFQALEESRVVPAHDAREDARTSEFAEGYLKPFGITSMMDVPVRRRGEFVGILCHEHTGALREWTIEEQDFASSAADMVSLSLEAFERRRAEEALREERNFVSAVLDTANTMVIVTDPQGRVVRTNRACTHTLGYPAEEVQGKAFAELFFAPEDAEPVRETFAQRASAASPEEYEHSWITKDGARPRIAWSRTSLQNADGSVRCFVVTGIDITQRKSLEEQLIHDAFHDALTGLPNRALFMDRLGQCLRHALRRKDRMFAVLFLDLDRFKLVNDSLGHMVGDRLLTEVARRLEACVRPGDTAARLGGDEFTVLLEDVQDSADAAQVAERIQQQLRIPIRLAGEEIVTTASIGIALSQTGYERPDDVLRDADIAMYRAKSKGGARHEVFDRAMHARAVALLKMETDLRRAIDRNEFIVQYQPVVSLRDGRIFGFEALVRWRHPERGLVPPVEFIHVSEETGLIIEIDRWVLLEACRQLKEWHAKYPHARPLTVSSNLSCRQFEHPDLADYVHQTLRRVGLQGDCLGLEITESVLMDNAETANRMLEEIRRAGVRLYLDDFGTGYSSLSYLHKFPIDALKIDRSFVGGIGPEGEGHEIVRTIVSLAQNLDIHVIAEGVETPEQLAALKALRCDYAQGYAFSRPVDRDTAEAMLSGQRPW